MNSHENTGTELLVDFTVGRTVCRHCEYEHPMSIFNLKICLSSEEYLGVTYVPKSFVENIKQSIERPLEPKDFEPVKDE